MISFIESLRASATDPSVAMYAAVSDQQDLYLSTMSSTFQGILESIQDQERYQSALTTYEATKRDYQRALERLEQQAITQGDNTVDGQVKNWVDGWIDTRASDLEEESGGISDDADAARDAAPLNSDSYLAAQKNKAAANRAAQMAQDMRNGYNVSGQADMLEDEADEAFALAQEAYGNLVAYNAPAAERNAAQALLESAQKTRDSAYEIAELARLQPDENDSGLIAAQTKALAARTVANQVDDNVVVKSKTRLVGEEVATVAKELEELAEDLLAGQNITNRSNGLVDDAEDALQDAQTHLNKLTAAAADSTLIAKAQAIVNSAQATLDKAKELDDLGEIAHAVSTTPQTYNIGDGYTLAIYSSGMVAIVDPSGNGVFIRHDGRVDSFSGDRQWQIGKTGTFILPNQTKITVNANDSTGSVIVTNVSTSVTINRTGTAGSSIFRTSGGKGLDRDTNDGYIFELSGDSNGGHWQVNGHQLGDESAREVVATDFYDNERAPLDVIDIDLSTETKEGLEALGISIAAYDGDGDGLLNHREIEKLLQEFNGLIEAAQKELENTLLAAGEAIDGLDEFLRFLQRVQRDTDNNAQTVAEAAARAREYAQRLEQQLRSVSESLQGENPNRTNQPQNSSQTTLTNLVSRALSTINRIGYSTIAPGTDRLEVPDNFGPQQLFDMREKLMAAAEILTGALERGVPSDKLQALSQQLTDVFRALQSLPENPTETDLQPVLFQTQEFLQAANSGIIPDLTLDESFALSEISRGLVGLIPDLVSDQPGVLEGSVDNQGVLFSLSQELKARLSDVAYRGSIGEDLTEYMVKSGQELLAAIGNEVPGMGFTSVEQYSFDEKIARLKELISDPFLPLIYRDEIAQLELSIADQISQRTVANQIKEVLEGSPDGLPELLGRLTGVEGAPLEFLTYYTELQKLETISIEQAQRLVEMAQPVVWIFDENAEGEISADLLIAGELARKIILVAAPEDAGPHDVAQLLEALTQQWGLIQEMSTHLKSLSANLFQKTQDTIQLFVQMWEQDSLIRGAILGDDLSDEQQAQFAQQMKNLQKEWGLEWGMPTLGETGGTSPGLSNGSIATKAITSGLMI